jgi:hypothetical protein
MKDIVRNRKSYISRLSGINKTTATISTSARLTTPSRAPLTRRKMSLGDEDVEDSDVKAFEQSRRALPKNLIRPLPVQDR